MQDALLILRAPYAYKTFDNLGTVTSTSASAAVSANGNTGFVAINNTNRIPRLGMALDITLPGDANGQVTTTNSPTALGIIFTVTWSDDGTNTVGGSEVSKSVAITIASNVGTAPGQLRMALADFNHKYIKVAWATTVTGGSSPTYSLGVLGIALIQDVNAALATDVL
jgi:hypothetical protein